MRFRRRSPHTRLHPEIVMHVNLTVDVMRSRNQNPTRVMVTMKLATAPLANRRAIEGEELAPLRDLMALCHILEQLHRRARRGRWPRPLDVVERERRRRRLRAQRLPHLQRRLGVEKLEEVIVPLRRERTGDSAQVGGFGWHGAEDGSR